RVTGEAQSLRALRGDRVDVRYEPVPDHLHLAEEDRGTCRPDALEALQLRGEAIGIVTRGVVQAAQGVAPVLLSPLGPLGQRGRGALVVAPVPSASERVHTLLPGARAHPVWRAPTGARELACGTHRDPRVDTGGEQRGEDEQPPQ